MLTPTPDGAEFLNRRIRARDPEIAVGEGQLSYTNKKQDLNFVLRYADPCSEIDTLEEHKQLLSLRGHIWFGKFGQGISKSYSKLAAQQISDGRVTYPYLLSRRRLQTRAKLGAISGGGARLRLGSPEPVATPAYYRNTKCSVWFCVVEFEACTIEMRSSLRLFNDPGVAPTFRTMRGLFYVSHSAQSSAIHTQSAQPNRHSAKRTRTTRTPAELADDEHFAGVDPDFDLDW